MRDLAKDLEICERMRQEVSWQAQNDFTMNAPQGLPEAIARAVAAEELVRKLQDEVIKTITGCEELQSSHSELLEENDEQRASIQQLSAQVAVMQGILRELLPNIKQQAEMIGYGLYNPADPRDFTPDPDFCTENELAQWKNDCRKAEAGEPIEHAGPTGWGIGTYVIRDAKMAEVRDRIKQALASLDPGEKYRERMAKMQAVVDAAKEVFKQIDLRTRTMGLDMSNYHAISMQVRPGEAGKDYWQAVWAYNKVLSELEDRQ